MLLILCICLTLQALIAKRHISLRQMMLHNLPPASPYPLMPSHSSLSSFFINDFEIFTLCLYVLVFMSGRNNDLVTKVKCENLESWNLLSSIAGMGVCEETLHLSDHQLIYLAKKSIPILHYICMV